MPTQDIVPTLHHLSSSQSQRVLFALEELAEAHGTEYKLKKYRRIRATADPALREVFPLGKSPILTIEENGAPSTTVYQVPQYPGIITESRLVLQFLSDTYGQGMWVPTSEADKRRDVYFQEFVIASLAGRIGFMLMIEMIAVALPFGIRQLFGLLAKQIVAVFMKDLKPMFQLMEEALSAEQPWFAGARMGVSDIEASWSMDLAVGRDYFAAEQYPKLKQWHQTIKARPAYQRALEKGGVYDLKRFT